MPISTVRRTDPRADGTLIAASSQSSSRPRPPRQHATVLQIEAEANDQIEDLRLIYNHAIGPKITGQKYDD